MQREFSYQQIYQLMRNFHNFGKNEVRIIDYLMRHKVAEVTITELAAAIGVTNKANIPNVHKAILNLEQMGIVCIVRKYYEEECEQGKRNPMKACFLVDGWLYAVLALNDRK